MSRTPIRARTRLRLAAAGVALAAIAADPTVEREAVALYDRGEYAQARVLLEQLAAAGEVSGPLLYRLHYTQVATGQDGAAQTLERAIARLEQELPAARDLEVPFYLVNAYQNVSRTADARRVCEGTTQRVERAELSAPTQPIEMFRLGKLYADLGQSEPATRWYTAALAGFGADDASAKPYIQWASRYLAEPAFRRGDFESAARFYREVIRTPGATAVDFDRLGVSEYRVGQYDKAAKAWDAAADLDNEDPDGLRYTSRLAALAADAGELPATAPDGRPWGQIPKEELQAVMQDQAARAKAALEESRQPVSLPQERIDELRTIVRDARAQFAAAGLEFAVHGYGIREAAFFGGYARMIFQKQEWRLGQGTPRQRGKRAD